MKMIGIVLVLAIIGFLSTGIVLAQSLQVYNSVDIGTLGGTESYTSNINNKGYVVGYSLVTATEAHAYLYKTDANPGEKLIDLGKLPGSANSYAFDLNEEGYVTGACYVSSGIEHAFLYNDKGMINLNTSLGSTSSRAVGINNSGQVVGNYNGGSFLYDYIKEEMVSLGPYTVRDINDKGQMAGAYYPSGKTHAMMLLSDGTITDLGTLGGNFTNSEAYGINENGQIVGASWYFTMSNPAVIKHAFLYSNGTMTDLGTLGGTYSCAMDINNNGQVVGYAGAYGALGLEYSHGFLWENGVIRDLNDITAKASGWTIDTAEAINDSGYIADAMGPGETYHAFLLTPVPGPATIAIIVVGINGIIFSRRQI